MPTARTSSRGTPTSPPAPRRRWRSKDARRVLKAWRRSGLSASAFARSIGIDAQRLLWWHKRLEATGDERSARAGAAPTALTFIPATFVPTASAAPVTVRFPGGVCLELGDPAAVPATWLAAVVAELGKVAS